MRILITGVRGFLGAVLERQALDAGWAVSGVDLDFYRDSHPDSAEQQSVVHSAEMRSDFRELQTEDLTGFDAVVHLAAISSDAACDLRAHHASRLNGGAAVDFARLAKKAGVARFVFASSCSVYGAAPNRISTERSPCTPVSTYALAKLAAEAGISAEASSTFSPTVLRFATLYGLSPNLRSDLVVNSMVASALVTGQIMLHGTGQQSRPLLNLRDASATILDVLKSSEDEMRGQVFNVTDEATGYSIAQIAEMVKRQVPGSHIVHHPAATDRRHYRVDGTRLHQFCRPPAVRLEDGLAEVADALQCTDWLRRAASVESNRAQRLLQLLERGELTDDLRWR